MFLLIHFQQWNKPNRFTLWPCQNVRDALHYPLDNIFKDLAQNCIDKLYVYLRVLIVLLLLHMCFCLVMRETSCCLFLTKIKQMLLNHLTLPQDSEMTCLILIILILNKW